MKTRINHMLIYKLAAALTSVFTFALFICANTNSCGMVYQPEAPAELSQFSKL